MDDEVLVINQEAARGEQNGSRQFLKEMYPDIEIYYVEEESVCSIYSTNIISGIYFTDRYFLDCCGGIAEYYRTINETVKDVNIL